MHYTKIYDLNNEVLVIKKSNQTYQQTNYTIVHILKKF